MHKILNANNCNYSSLGLAGVVGGGSLVVPLPNEFPLDIPNYAGVRYAAELVCISKLHACVCALRWFGILSKVYSFLVPYAAWDRFQMTLSWISSWEMDELSVILS